MPTEARIGIGGLAAALADDRDAAFPRLVRALQDGVFAGALRLTGSRADAEEITQEAFVRAYRALGAYPDERVRELRVREWVWTIALNLCRNRARGRSRRPENLAADKPPGARPGTGPRATGAGRRRPGASGAAPGPAALGDAGLAGAALRGRPPLRRDRRRPRPAGGNRPLRRAPRPAAPAAVNGGGAMTDITVRLAALRGAGPGDHPPRCARPRRPRRSLRDPAQPPRPGLRGLHLLAASPW